MSCKYFSDGKIKMNELRHDLVSLVDPLSMSIEFVNSEKSDKAILIQKEVLKNLKKLVNELKNHSDDSKPTNS